MRVTKAGMIARHRHSGAVYAWVFKGRWDYLEHDWVAEEGSYIFEPPGETYTLVVPENCSEMITFFQVNGSLMYVDPQGISTGYDDVFTPSTRRGRTIRQSAWVNAMWSSSFGEQTAGQRDLEGRECLLGCQLQGGQADRIALITTQSAGRPLQISFFRVLKRSAFASCRVTPAALRRRPLDVFGGSLEVSANTASSTARIADTAAGSIVRYPGHFAVRLTFLSHASKLDVDVKRGHRRICSAPSRQFRRA